MTYYLYKVKFSCQTLTFCDGKVGPGSRWVRTGLARWIRIRIKVGKKLDPDPNSFCNTDIYGLRIYFRLSQESTFDFLIQKRGGKFRQSGL
jgi:hypothetical protein